MQKQITLEDIKSIDHNKLADLLYGLIDTDNLLYEKIENMLVADNPVELHKNIKKNIASIKRGRRFIDYRESFEFAEKVASIAEDIDMLVADKKSASKLLKELILTDSKVYLRSDDSAGYIQTSYHMAEDAWCENAVGSLSQKELLKDLEDLLICDGFGLRSIFSEALPQQVLQELYDKCFLEYTLGTSSFEKFDMMSILKKTAHYLKLPELYIKAVKLEDKTLEDYQLLEIAREYQYCNDAQNALHYLNKIKIEGHRAESIYQLYIWAYELLKRPMDITLTYKKWYEKTKSPQILQKYLSRLEGKMREQEKQKAFRDASHFTFTEAIRFYETLNEKALCATYIMNHQDKIETIYLDEKVTIGWLANEYPQEAILLYRNVAEEALATKQSKYYGGAIWALKKIKALEAKNDTLSWSIEENSDYIKRLLEIHKKKRKFIELYTDAFGDEYL